VPGSDLTSGLQAKHPQRQAGRAAAPPRQQVAHRQAPGGEAEGTAVTEQMSMGAAGQIGDLSGAKAGRTRCQQADANPGKQALERVSMAADMLSVHLTAQPVMNG